MLPPQACVAVEVAGPVAADEQRAALEHRCSEILGPGRCRIVIPEDVARAASCWRARVTPGGTPDTAAVLLADPSEPASEPVRRDLTFRPNDVPTERWATLGLVIAALVTVEEHSAADDVATSARGPAGDGFQPVIVAAAPPPVPLAVRGAVGASAVASIGVLPHAAVGGRFEAALGGERLAFVARGTLYPASTRANIAASGAPAAGGDFDLASFGAGACGFVERGPWRARFCAGGDLARTRARGFGVAQTSDASAWWQAAWLGFGSERRLASHLAFFASVEGAALFHRPTFAIEGAQGAVFTPAPVAATATLGLLVPWP